MTNQNGREQCVLGMVGLGVMGRNLLLNMADQGFQVAGYDMDQAKVQSLQLEAKERNVFAATSIEEFVKLLRKPRAIMLLVPAGQPVDLVIHELLPHLQAGDLIIDAGNSHFKDTDRRAAYLQEQNIQFLGVGVSGGEAGARHGPSLMPGGPQSAYAMVRPIFEAIAAKVDGEHCVAYMGIGSAGHYVKMIHNGIEYGMMQLIAETYDLMKRGLGLTNAELCEIYRAWNDRELNSYLIEITSNIFGKMDEKTGQQLIDEISDVAKQLGTGMWTSESAMALQVPVPTIDLAVSIRDLSGLVKEREEMCALYQRPSALLTVDRTQFLKQLQDALYTSMITVFAEGFALLAVASKQYAYDLDFNAVARIWRGGCIIRAKLLDDIANAFHANAHLTNLLLDPNLSQRIKMHEASLRQVVSVASLSGLPIPALMVTLSYLDAFRSQWLPTNLIQAQRDYFGAHTYARNDREGTFHTEWEQE